jgi:hypothetical protein
MRPPEDTLARDYAPVYYQGSDLGISAFALGALIFFLQPGLGIDHQSIE